ncbi:MAG: KilA-N domain-containing protein [Flavobacteriaceae bacterium]|nr:KilA-N domain-containing protein [Flavobacteriaceae bacterium]
MSKESKSQAQAENEQFSVLQYHGSNVAFEEINGRMMVNATQMAKPFGKTPKDWLRTQQAKDLLNVVSKRHICPLDDLQIVKHGGVNRGTLFQEDVALFFAQWLSPDFYLACNTKLKQLLTEQALILPPKHNVSPIVHEGKALYPYVEVMKVVANAKRPSASRRKKRHPNHFFMVFGRNFITGHYFDLLKGFYDYKKASTQLKLSL